MNKFYFSRTYTFEAPEGRRKHYFFNLVDRTNDEATIRLRDKNNTDEIVAPITNYDITERVAFEYKGMKFQLAADRYIPKGYDLTDAGRSEKHEDMLKDYYLHTIYNASDFKSSNNCGCICCQRIFPVDEVEDFVDLGQTALCPHCGCDSLIADGSGCELTKELIAELNKKYF